MNRAGLRSSLELDELESHLREEIHSLVASGIREGEAFEMAALRLGVPTSVGREFEKIRRPSSNVVWVVTAIWVLGAVLADAFIFYGLVDGRVGILLASHVMMITAGYMAALVVGVFGAFQISSMARGTESTKWARGLSNAVYRFTRIAMVTVAVGFLLGCFWSRENLGSYFRADPRELGAIVVTLWLAWSWKAQHSRNSSKQRVMLLSVGTSLVAGLAWFGAPLFGGNSRLHSYGYVTFWPLILFVILHVGFGLVAVLRCSDEKVPS